MTQLDDALLLCTHFYMITFGSGGDIEEDGKDHAEDARCVVYIKFIIVLLTVGL